MFAIIDCNNFYVSCERVFNPQLWHKPVVVLSNNDGCFVARSNEVKQLGIPMGAPWFKWKEQVKQLKCQVLSSNYALYGDMSTRVMSTIYQLHDPEKTAVYSIDEAFLEFEDNLTPEETQQIGHHFKQTIEQNTGIPVSIGFARTKTLAKVANEIAKKDSRSSNHYQGIVSLVHSNPNELEKHLKSIEVRNIWGVGRANSQKLNEKGIRNAYQLSQWDSAIGRKHLSIQGSRIIQELNNIRCYNLDKDPITKKGISSTRSFGKAVTNIEELQEAMAMYSTIIGRKLRKSGQATSCIAVFARTSRHTQNHYHENASYHFETQTNYTPDILKAALHCLDKIYRPGVLFKKAGIFATGLVEDKPIRRSLFHKSTEEDEQKQKSIMQTMDNLNRRYGQETIHLARYGFKQNWRMKNEHRSPRYTTVWNEILKV